VTLRWSQRAAFEQEAQLDYIALDKPSAADRMAAIIEKNTELLATWPALGKPGKVLGTRELVIPQTPFLVVYRVLGDDLEIVRFLHGAQRYPR
jgi:toxin ParE1/3/4